MTVSLASMRAGAGVLGAAAALWLAGCGGVGAPERERLAEGDIRLVRMTQPSAPPEIVSRDVDEIDDAARAAGRDRLASLRAQRGAARIEAPQLGFLYAAPLGRAYLAARPGKALARGAPADRCPMLGAAFDQPDPQAAAQAAMTRCLSQRPSDDGLAAVLAEGAAPCECRLLAVDDVLFAPPPAFEYASGVHVELTLSGARRALVAVAPSPPPADVALAFDAAAAAAYAAGERRILLTGPEGVIAELRLAPNGAAEAVFADGARWVGRRASVGFRRGRVAELIALQTPRGARAELLVGFEPAELAERGDALRAAAGRLALSP